MLIILNMLKYYNIIKWKSILFDNYTDKIKINLEKNKIFSRKYYHPLDNTLIAENIYNKILCIPCTNDMSIEDIDNIINILNESC